MIRRSDPFGLQREQKIIASNVRKIFTPHQPVNSTTLFLGRQNEVQKLVEHINTPGQHSLLYGERGVGKSSLANIAAELLISQLIKGRLYKKRCDSKDTFDSVVALPLRAAGVDPSITGQTNTLREGGDAGLKIPVLKAGVHTERESTKTSRPAQLSPSLVAEQLSSFQGLLLVDEADAIATADDKKRLSELIKLLSDNGSEFKILVVGIAETAEELTAGHPSVQRCLKETKLKRMLPNELALIVTEGAKKIGIVFDLAVVHAIVRLSAGYPHFTHLLALKCAEEAIAADRENIVLDDLNRAMDLAVEDAEGTLRRIYNNAIRSYSTSMYEDILCAAASLSRDEFSAGQLRSALEALTNSAITQASLNNFLKRLISDNSSTILVRKAKGIYKFADPRMPSFVRIARKQILEDASREANPSLP